MVYIYTTYLPTQCVTGYLGICRYLYQRLYQLGPIIRIEFEI